MGAGHSPARHCASPAALSGLQPEKFGGQGHNPNQTVDLFTPHDPPPFSAVVTHNHCTHTAMSASIPPDCCFGPRVSLFASSGRRDFAATPDTSSAYSRLVELFDKVQVKAMSTPLPWAQTGLRADFNHHMELYFAWPFLVIRRRACGSAGQIQRRQVEQNGTVFARNRGLLAKERQQTYAALTEAQRDVERVRLKWCMPRIATVDMAIL